MRIQLLVHTLFIFSLAACVNTPPPTIPPGPFTPGAASPAAATAAPSSTAIASTSTTGAPSATKVPPSNTPVPVATSTPGSKPTVAAPTATATAPQPTATVTHAGLDMRDVDWFRVVTTDPKLTYDASIAPPPGQTRAPWVRLKSNPALEGHALVSTDQILFLDISGDGQEEAVISLFSGGTAGNLGLLVYTASGGAPVLADALAGYKIGGTADGALLMVSEPIYQGWESNCCPSGFFETRYRLETNHLVQVSRMEKPLAEARRMTVDKFYELLLARNYADAYNMFLSAAFRAGHPYDRWTAGYANTLSFTATTSDNPDGTIHVDLVSKDKTAGGTLTHHFVGTWKLTWVSTARFKQWVLDTANFVEVP
jgi:hypothetical protein